MRSASRFRSLIWLPPCITVALAVLQLSPRLYGRAERDALPSISLTIRVYDQVPLDDGYLQGGKTIATRAFERMAINVRWQDVPDPFAGPPALDYSNNPPTLCLHEIGTKIVRSAPPGTESQILAMALPRSHGALQIVLYWDRIRGLSARVSSLCPNITTVLGYVLVHEVAHVLLGSTEHSEAGIMRAHWGVPEFLKMERGELRLDKNELIAIFRRCGAW